MAQPNQDAIDKIKAIGFLQKSPLEASTRVSTKVAQGLLMADEPIKNKGALCYLRMRKLGLGVWDIWLVSGAGHKKTSMIVKN